MVFIKQVIIQGFKSYKDQTVLPEFDPGHNVVVGKNGSGKSNFFSAIRFVLSDMFSTLRADERQNLLHEGTGSATVSGYVEIIFDNTDSRFPVDSEEVLLKRAIGLKKDEFYLNLKHVTKSDVVNLLESAGFSRSNPYYIVQQGRVNALATMKDTDRLELLKEVAGTSVYDARRDESLKIMHETEARRSKILEIIFYIDERLAELDEEKEELSEYQRLDKERRSLEYALYDRDLNDIIKKLQQIEQERAEGSKSGSEHHEELREIQDHVADLERDLRQSKSEIEQLLRDKLTFEASRSDQVQARAKAELKLQEIEEMSKSDASSKTKLRKLLKDLEAKTKSETKNLEKATAAAQQAHAEEQEIRNSLQDAQKDLNVLQSKQGRKQQFSSVAERDTWIKTTVTTLQETIKSAEKQVKQLEKEAKSLRTDVGRHDEEQKNIRLKIDERKALIEQASKDLRDMAQQRNELQNRRKELWKRSDELQQIIDSADEEEKRSEIDLQSTMNRDMSTGLRAVKRLVHEHQIEGVYGPLMDLFDCDEKVATAVEVTAGNGLFDVVVDCSATAQKLIELLNRERAGRVTFLPLRDLRPKKPDYPKNSDVFPMIQRLKIHNPDTMPAFQQIFGKTLICRSLEVASRTADEVDLDCVTLEGDKVNRKGAVTGGYHDRRTSRLRCLRKMKEQSNRKRAAAEERKAVVEESEAIDQKISQVLGDMQKEESRKARNFDSIQALSKELEKAPDMKRRLEDLLQEKESSLSTARFEIKRDTEHIADLEKELGTPLDVTLSSSEAKNITRLTQLVQELEKTLAAKHATALELVSKRDSIQIHVDTSLVKQTAEAQAELEKLLSGDSEMTVEQAKAEFEEAQRVVDESLKAIESIAIKVTELESKVEELSTELDKARSHESKLSAQMQEASKTIERLVNRKSALMEEKDELMKKIRDLGPLSSESNSYAKMTLSELQKQKQKCSGQLKKYSHVNKKALDQYINFTDQRNELVKRKEELDQGAQSIQELIEVLDQRKDEAIERTFKDVAKNFSSVFSELVPQGSASLVMLKKRARDHEGEEEAEEADETSRIGQYKGVAIRASFTGAGDPHLLNQLSGGQKCLVALTLIFSIQRCDPAPFYLFDEIDANLDAAHRTAVANLIKKQSAEAQFITTTFRPEFLHVADRFYGVTFSNKISRIGIISSEEALGVIAEEAGRNAS